MELLKGEQRAVVLEFNNQALQPANLTSITFIREILIP